MENKNLKISPFSLIKRDDLPLYKSLIIRFSSVIITFIFSITIVMLVIKADFFEIVGTIFEGAFIRPWKLLLDTFILLGFGMVIVPSFKMKYWNMGANGSVLVGSLASIVVMFYLGSWGNLSKINNFLLICLMFVVSIIASIIWAVVPAIFKVFFKTNETLFSLMMNYIAACLVAYINYIMAEGKKESPGIINLNTESGWLPVVIDKYFIPIVVILLITVFIHIYLYKTKHGYEVIVVGDSINTAKYVRMNTNKIIIRTLILSGVTAGIIGFLYTSSINHSINPYVCGSLGFTAILVAWLSNFNPLTMAGVSFFIAFLTNGTSKVSSQYRLGSNNLSSVIIGLVFFSILVSEFIIRYKVKFNRIKKEVK